MSRINFATQLEATVKVLESRMKHVGLIKDVDTLTSRVGTHSNGYPHRISIKDGEHGGETPLIEHSVTVNRADFKTAVSNYSWAIECTRLALSGQKFYL